VPCGPEIRWEGSACGAHEDARVPAQGLTHVAICSGSNMNFDRLRLVAELADIGAHVRPGRIAAAPYPGSLRRLRRSKTWRAGRLSQGLWRASAARVLRACAARGSQQAAAAGAVRAPDTRSGVPQHRGGS